MFWAVTCESGKRYSQIPEEPFCITMASLEPRENLPENKQVTLMVEHSGKEFLLCTLEYDRVMQVNMNLKFNKGEETFFFISGEGTIHLSGHTLDNDDKAAEKKCLDDIYNQPSTSRGITSAVDEEASSDEDDDEDDDDDDDDSQEEEVGVGTDRLLALDNSDEEDSEEWNPELEKPTRSKRKQPSKRESAGTSEVVVSDSNEEDDDDDDDDEEEGEDSDELLNEASDLEDDDEDDDEDDMVTKKAAMEAGETSSRKRKKVLPVSSVSKRLKHEGYKGKKCSTLNFQGVKKKAKGNAQNDASDSEEEEDDDEEDDDDENSSIGRTPMRKFNQHKVKTSPMNQSVKGQASPSNADGAALKPVSEKFSHSLASGVEYEDIRVGNGPVAKNGKFIHVYYVGRLQNGQVFDSVKEGKGKPFAIRLGKNEVIAGWDEGLLGMRVGGKRRLKIPPKMGYGNKKVPGIPPNSTLYFTVELKAVT